MPLSPSSSVPTLAGGEGLRRKLPSVLVVISAFALGIGVGVTRSAALGAAVLVVSTGLGIAIVAGRPWMIRPTPKKIVPLGLSPVFAVTLSGGAFLVGRSPSCDIILPLATVSGHHCRLYCKGRNWFVEDLQSCNGTLVNNNNVRRKRLRVGDKLSIGELEFLVR